MQNNIQYAEFYGMKPTTIAKMATIGLTDKNISRHTFTYNETNASIIDVTKNNGTQRTQRYRIEKSTKDRHAVIKNDDTGEKFIVLNFEQLINEIQLRADLMCMDIKDIANHTVNILDSKGFQNHYFTSNADGTVSDTNLTIQEGMGKTKTYKFSYYDQYQMLMTDNLGHQAMVRNLKDITNNIVNGM